MIKNEFMGNEATKQAQDTLSEISKTYGLSLSQISVVKVKEKEYLKFYDENSNTIKMIENGKESLNERFKDIQQDLSYAQGTDEVSNAKNIFEHEEKYVRTAITLLPVLELETNFSKYTQNMDVESVRKVLFFVKNARALEITHINVDECMCINEEQEVLYPDIDPVTGNYVIKKAEIKIYENQTAQVDQDNYLLEIDGINFDEVVEGIDITVPSDTPLVIAGEEIDLNSLSNYINYPELLERQVESQQISVKRKTILQYLIEAYNRKLLKKQNQNAKRLTFTLPNKAAFADALLLAVLSSLAAAAITFIVYF